MHHCGTDSPPRKSTMPSPAETLALTPALIARLRACRRAVIFTGAGMSAESGVPTFRDAQTGFWARFKPEDVASPQAFAADPQLVWDWYVHRAEIVRGARPNPGHQAIAALQDRFEALAVITQNVDRLHQQAGSREVLELHGNLFDLKGFEDPDANTPPSMHCALCGGPCAGAGQTITDAAQREFEGLRLAEGAVPACPACGCLLRPAVVWFGEFLDPRVFSRARDLVAQCDLLVCVGASLAVQPAAGLPAAARHHGALVIEINLAPTSLSGQCDAFLQGAAAELLPQLVHLLDSA